MTTAIKEGEFEVLEKYMGPEKSMYVRGCDDMEAYTTSEAGASPPRTFDQIRQILKADSAGITLRTTVRYIREYKFQLSSSRYAISPDVIHEEMPDEISIFADGWIGEVPFGYFTFKEYDGRWFWSGLCFEGSPDPDFAYDQPPKLPRPGPRRFIASDYLTQRIEEIVRFREFDALRPYAIRGVIKEVPCDQRMFNRPPKGKEVPISQVIKFLKDQSVGGNEITFTKFSLLESSGCGRAYPIINFIVHPTPPDSRYEWTGVAYCQNRILEGPRIMFFPGGSGVGQ